jgi:hypothetical protein
MAAITSDKDRWVRRRDRRSVAAEPARTRSQNVADLRKDNGPAIKKVCAQFVELCRKMGLLAAAAQGPLACAGSSISTATFPNTSRCEKSTSAPWSSSPPNAST